MPEAWSRHCAHTWPLRVAETGFKGSSGTPVSQLDPRGARTVHIQPWAVLGLCAVTSHGVVPDVGSNSDGP